MAEVEESTIVRIPLLVLASANLLPFGPRRATQLVVMCPGYPNDHQPVTPLAKRLSGPQQCLVRVMCLPGYDFAAKKKTAVGGYSFHDWGVIAGLQYVSPTLPDSQG